MDDHGLWTSPQDDEIGRFLNVFGERFVVYRDMTFAGDETGWKRAPMGEEFIFSPAELAAVVGIVRSCFGDNPQQKESST